MAKKKTVTPKRKIENAKPNPLDNEAAFLMANGLTEAIMGFNPGSIGVELSQTTTLFKNLRWYLVSNMRQLLSESYAEHGLIQTIVDVPVDDAFRGGIVIKSKQLDEEEIGDLQATLDRQSDILEVAQANKWNRLYGGAAVIIMTDQDPMQPFDINSLNEDSLLKFRAVDMWELFFDKVNIDEETDHGVQLEKPNENLNYNYYGKKVHHSRVMPMKGLLAPSFLRPRLRGWGFSVVETLVRSMNQYLKACDLGFEVLDEFKLDIFKIKGLNQALLNAGGTEKIRNRLALANHQKSYQNAIAMDSEDDYVQKQLTWAGLGEAMAGIRMQIASDMRMPQIKLFGQGPSGLNASGEDEIEVYNAMVESQVRAKCKYEIVRVVEIRCQQMFGHVPDDITIEFKPLRVLSSEQEENVKTQKFNRLIQAKTSGEITSFEFRDAVNRDNLLPVQLETDDAALTALEEEKAAAMPDEAEESDNASDKEKEKKANSLEYDVASYQTDGGDGQFDEYHQRDLQNPDRIPNRALVFEGEHASMKAFGEIKWQFVFWYYLQHGGPLK